MNIIKEKRKISLLLPIRRKGEALFVYLQKRSATAKTLPNYFGFWGGGAEKNESSEQTLLREIQEELGFKLDLKETQFFNHYEFLRSVKDVYLFEPQDNWEQSLVIGEGDYGKWFSTQEALMKTDIIFEDKVVINDLERILLQKPII